MEWPITGTGTGSILAVVWGLPRCVWARESTAPAQGNQSLSRELRAYSPGHSKADGLGVSRYSSLSAFWDHLCFLDSQPVCRPGDSLHRLLPSVALHGEGLQYPPLEDQQHHWLRIFLHLQHPLRQQGLQPLRDRVLEELQVKLQGCLQGGRGEQG